MCLIIAYFYTKVALSYQLLCLEPHNKRINTIVGELKYEFMVKRYEQLNKLRVIWECTEIVNLSFRVEELHLDKKATLAFLNKRIIITKHKVKESNLC